MLYTISKEFQFSASHQLIGLPNDHPCSRLHGHNYTVIVELSDSCLDNTGFVEDYGTLKDVKELIDSEFDHHHLNAILNPHHQTISLNTLHVPQGTSYLNPTAENIARVLYNTIKRLHPKLTAVIVKETPKTAARYEG